MENNTEILKHFDKVFNTEILKHFDKVFNTETAKHIKFNNMKLLKALYEYFEEDVYTPNTKYSELRHKHIEISDELEKTFTPEQKQLFERYWKIGSEMTAEENQQLFLFGFIMARELDIETHCLD